MVTATATNCQRTTPPSQLYMKIFRDYLLFMKMPFLESSKQTMLLFNKSSSIKKNRKPMCSESTGHLLVGITTIIIVSGQKQYMKTPRCDCQNFFKPGKTKNVPFISLKNKHSSIHRICHNAGAPWASIIGLYK